MKTDLKELAFPVLCFSQGTLVTARSGQDLTRCSRKAFAGGYFGKLRLVDANRICYQAGSVQIVSIGFLGKIRAILTGQVEIEFQGIVRESEISLGALKERVCGVIEADQDFWSSVGDVQELADEVRQAKSYEEIAEMFV